MKNRSCRTAQYAKVFLLVAALLVVLFAGACRSARVAPDGSMGPPWNTAGLRAKAAPAPAGEAGSAVHATESRQDSSWGGKGFVKSTKPAESPASPAPGSPSLPPEGATLSFDECVILAAQQAPDLVDSVIDLELAEIKADTAYWKRLPSINARFHVTANLTQQHEEYRDTVARLDFGIYGFEPVASQFTYRAERLLQDVALSTHQKAVEKRGEQIGVALLHLENLERVRERQAARLALAKQQVAFQQANQGEAGDRLETASARHQEKAAQAALEKTDAAMASLYLSLKLMLGVDLDRQIKARGGSVGEVLQSDKASAALATNQWAEIWNASLDARIARATLKLQDYNIMLAWSKYLPSVSMEVVTANPDSSYASYSSKDDVFVHLYFTLPLFDWGERSRGVDSARLQKSQTSQKSKLVRLAFAQQWKEEWLNMKMARADLDFARERLAVAKLKAQKASLQHSSGEVPFNALVSARTTVINEEIAVEDAALQLRLKEFSAWMMSGSFRNRFFQPRKGVEDLSS